MQKGDALTVAKKCLWTGMVSCVVAVCLLLPDYLFRFFNPADKAVLEGHYLWVFALFGLGLVLVKSTSFRMLVLLLIACLELTQFGHLAYFGSLITPPNVGLIFTETDEILPVIQNAAPFLYYVPLIVAIPYLFIFFLIKKTRRFCFKTHCASVLLLGILLFVPIQMFTNDKKKDLIVFYPNPTTASLVNTLKAYSAFVVASIPGSPLYYAKEKLSFSPYTVSCVRTPPPMTVVIIMGESFTYTHMSLFGYSRKTTPNLEQLAGQHKLIFKPGISAAVYTKTSLPLFFNVQREPNNSAVFEADTTNLFRLAREQGFSTTYISAQESNLLKGIGQIDKVITEETNPTLFLHRKDEGLLEYLKQVPLKDRNFIVLHQRNTHAPYEENYAYRRETFAIYPDDGVPYATHLINSYDNATLYNDHLYQQIFSFLKTHVKTPLYVFVTSDHGELLGESGLYGHSVLNLGAAKVPFMLYSEQGDPSFLQEVQSLNIPTHYEVGVLIAKLLGYSIYNPAFQPNTYFVNGTGTLGKDGFMQILKGPKHTVHLTKIWGGSPRIPG